MRPIVRERGRDDDSSIPISLSRPRERVGERAGLARGNARVATALQSASARRRPPPGGPPSPPGPPPDIVPPGAVHSDSDSDVRSTIVFQDSIAPSVIFCVLNK